MQANTRLHNYQIKRILGKGGMGTVYLATQTNLQRQVAIKELLPELSRNTQIRLRYKNEALLMAHLTHPNIVALYDYIESPEGVFLIMEYVEGISLDKYIKGVTQGGIPESKLKNIFEQILTGVEYAHKAGIVHRDIKPSNILITPEGNIKITDFGIAKNIESEEKNMLTRTGMRMGTIYYMSPEQVKALPTDYRSDIYALGVMLFELLTGVNPYQNIASEYDIFQKILLEPLPRIREILLEENPFFQKIIDKATAKNPAERFNSVEDFLKAFKQEINFEPASNHTKTWGQTEQKLNKDVPHITIELKYPDEKPKKVKEVLLLNNEFGIITNKKIHFWEGKDLFEKGAIKEIQLKKIIDCELKAHREIGSGLFFILLSIPMLIFYFSPFILFFSSICIVFSLICFLEFPTIIINTDENKKIKMKGWAWHYYQAQEFCKILQNSLHKNQ